MTSDERIGVMDGAYPHDGDGDSGPPEHRRTGAQAIRCHAPDLIGLDAPGAHALARSAGVRLVVSVWETSVGPWSNVLEQRPAAGSPIRRGSSVLVIVSGRPNAAVPDVRGLPLDIATEQLCWLGLVPLALTRSSAGRVPAGHIVTTRPAPGALVADGSVVALTVARPARSGSRRLEPR